MPRACNDARSFAVWSTPGIPSEHIAMDNDRLSAITRNIDPLAIVGIFFYYFTRDLFGFHLSEETLLWFAAAGASIRITISKTIDRWQAERVERQRQAERAELRRLIAQHEEVLKKSVETCLALNGQTNNGTTDSDDSQVLDIPATSHPTGEDAI